MKFTKKSLGAFTAPAGKSDHIEFETGTVPGFGLRVRGGQLSRAVWIFQYSLGTKQRRFAIGKASAFPPEKARAIAADLHAKVRLGGDPAADKAESRIAAALSFKAVADRFLARHASSRSAVGST